MTTFGGATIPPLFTGVSGIVTSVIVDNSVGTGILTWGGFIFPIDISADTGHYKVGARDAAGDTIYLDQNWSGEPPIAPPDFVMEVTQQVGDFADFGSSAWTSFNTACRSINNGARWEAAVGVAQSRTVSFHIEYINSPAASCPGTTTFAEFDYTVTGVWTG